ARKAGPRAAFPVEWAVSRGNTELRSAVRASKGTAFRTIRNAKRLPAVGAGDRHGHRRFSRVKSDGSNSILPHRHRTRAHRLVRQVRRIGGADAGLGRAGRFLAALDAFHPVRQVQQFAVRLVVEVLAALLVRAQDLLLELALVALGVKLVA